MLLLGKLGWDVSGVTAFDFVDHLMERIDLSPSVSNQSSSGSVKDAAAVLRGHALTYVSLCCTGTVLSLFLSCGCVSLAKEEAARSIKAPRFVWRTSDGAADDPDRAAVSSPLSIIIIVEEREREEKKAMHWMRRDGTHAPIAPLTSPLFMDRCLYMELFDASAAVLYSQVLACSPL